MKLRNFEKFNEKVDTDFIKSEVDNYMFSITDDYQLESSDDKIYNNKNELKIIYHNIKIEREDIDIFIDKLEKIDKIIKREFNLFILGLELDSDDMNVWIGWENDIKKNLYFYYESDIMITIEISGDL